MANGIIKLSPEELMSQSTELTSLMSEFETFFSELKSQLNSLNGEWSEAISRNFTGKLQNVQVGCAGIVDMIRNGASAAKLGSLTFSQGSSVDNILGSMMKYGESKVFKEIDSIVKSLGSGDEATIAEKLLSKNYDTETIKNVLKDVKDGNYESAIKAVYEKGKDIFGDAMSIGTGGTWVDTVNKATGGKLGLSNLVGDYYENWFFGTIEKGADVVKKTYSGDYSTKEQVTALVDCAWNFGPGAVLKTAGDAAYKAATNIPMIDNYYESKGATDAGSAFSIAYGDFAEMITGNSETGDYFRNYYKDHGGVAGGLVDGITDIADFVGDKFKNSDFINSFSHSILA